MELGMKPPTFFAAFAFLFPISLFCIIAARSDDTKSPPRADNTAERSVTSTESRDRLDAERQMLENLRSHRQQMVESLKKGEEHPIVKRIDEQIDATARRIDALNAVPVVPDPDPLKRLRRDVQSMNDQQLRATAELLIDRLLKLENSVREINEPRARLLH
jgi:hypothetical protein